MKLSTMKRKKERLLCKIARIVGKSSLKEARLRGDLAVLQEQIDLAETKLAIKG